MSIGTDVSRIKGAKSAIKTAIEGKGVTVPADALLDAYAPLIDSIQSGEGGNVACGLITPTDTNAAELEITHGLGSVPKFLFIAAATNNNGVYSQSTPHGQSFIYAIKSGTDDTYYCEHREIRDADYVSGSISKVFTTGLGYYLRADSQKFAWANRNTTYGFCATAAPFLWVALRELSV